MTSVIGALRVNLGLDSADFDAGLKRALSGVFDLSDAFGKLAGAFTIGAFGFALNAAAGRIEETRRLTAQLDQAIANTGNTARTSGQEVADFADRLERSTGRAAEEILAVSSNLATFGFNREVFFEVIELADDMAAAWGGDLRQNIEGVARALADPEKGLAMLTKRGITFTDQQQAQIAAFRQQNDLIGAQGVILEALQEQVRGVAAAGFTGLTAAQARATLATEEFFEAIANGLGVNSGLEAGLNATAGALNFISDNFSVISRAAIVAGVSIATAFGPVIWSAIATAAGAAFRAIVVGLNLVRAAILANPIGLIAVALAGAITAAIAFRDEIRQAIGIDFVGIVRGAVNNTIGLFVGAYDSIIATWNLIPAAFSDIFTRALNGSIEIVQNGVNAIIGALRNVPGLGNLEDADLSGFIRDESGALNDVGRIVQETFSESFSRDYLGGIAEALGLVGDESEETTRQVTALSDATTEFSGAGSAAAEALKKLQAEGKAVYDATRTSAEQYAIEIERLNRLLQAGAIDQDTYNRAVLQAQDAFHQTGRIGEQVTSTLQSGFADLFKGLIRGTTSAGEAISNLLGRLGDLFIDQAFNILFNGTGGVGGIGAGIGSFFQNLFKFERGGTILPGGGGGIDSQLVAFRKSPNERVDITKPGQTLFDGSQQNNVHITTGVAVDGQGSISSYVQSVVQNGIEVFNDALPVRVQQINADPRAR